MNVHLRADARSNDMDIVDARITRGTELSCRSVRSPGRDGRKELRPNVEQALA